jgi:hypothetical protein
VLGVVVVVVEVAVVVDVDVDVDVDAVVVVVELGVVELVLESLTLLLPTGAAASVNDAAMPSTNSATAMLLALISRLPPSIDRNQTKVKTPAAPETCALSRFRPAR